jgi:hypothetical protein
MYGPLRRWERPAGAKNKRSLDSIGIDEEITRMRGEGATCAAIAAVLDISRQAVHLRAKRLGLPLPQRLKKYGRDR